MTPEQRAAAIMSVWCNEPGHPKNRKLSDLEDRYAAALRLLFDEAEDLRKKLAELKWEYDNVAKFATDFEQQRDKLKEELRKMTVVLSGLCRLKNYRTTHGKDVTYENLREVMWRNAYELTGVEELKQN